MVSHDQALIAVLKEERDALLNACSSATHCPSANSAAREETDALLDALQEALQGDAPDDLRTEGWSHARQLLDALSASRAAQGQSAGDTSAFVLALKQPIFAALQQRLGQDSQSLLQAVVNVTTKLDAMAQWTATAFQRTREELIARQQQELLELSTPVIKLWEGVLAVPMIGTLDSSRTQMVWRPCCRRSSTSNRAWPPSTSRACRRWTRWLRSTCSRPPRPSPMPVGLARQ